MQIAPEHLSKGEGFDLQPGDWIEVGTPGGGGYGDPAERPREAVEADREKGYYPAPKS